MTSKPQPVDDWPEIPGRDGTGPCRLKEGRTAVMPNGEVLGPGDTFDPVAEGMTYERFSLLFLRRAIEPMDSKQRAEIDMKLRNVSTD